MRLLKTTFWRFQKGYLVLPLTAERSKIVNYVKPLLGAEL
jgi:hypothetical protein